MRSHRRRGLGALALLALAGLLLLGGALAAARPGRDRPRVLDRGGARDLERRPNGRNAIEGRDVHARGDDAPHGRLSPLHEGWGDRMRDDPKVVGDNDGIPGPADPRPRRRPDPRPLQESRQRVRAVALDALPRGQLPGRLGRRVSPRILRARRERQAGAVVHLPARGRAAVGGRLALSRPLAVDGRLDPRRHVRRALHPRPEAEAPPDREFVVYFGSTLDFDTINGRAFVGNTPVFRAKSAR